MALWRLTLDVVLDATVLRTHFVTTSRVTCFYEDARLQSYKAGRVLAGESYKADHFLFEETFDGDISRCFGEHIVRYLDKKDSHVVCTAQFPGGRF